MQCRNCADALAAELDGVARAPGRPGDTAWSFIDWTGSRKDGRASAAGDSPAASIMASLRWVPAQCHSSVEGVCDTINRRNHLSCK